MSKIGKKAQRLRRSKRTRCHIKQHLGVPRLVVYRSPKHIYGQVIISIDGNDIVVASASSLQKDCVVSGQYTGNQLTAKDIGKHIAERAKAKGITNVAFDRSGYKYHGRVKAFADGAREAGLIF